jgi:hypothetical protein
MDALVCAGDGHNVRRTLLRLRLPSELLDPGLLTSAYFRRRFYVRLLLDGWLPASFVLALVFYDSRHEVERRHWSPTYAEIARWTTEDEGCRHLTRSNSHLRRPAGEQLRITYIGR